MIILGIIAAVIAVCMIIGAALHATYFKEKLEHIEPYGQLVNVHDGQMHVYSVGSGEKTIVLLPGMGVALPSAEFGPLMRRLSEEYTVVCVEYFGVGFSSETAKPRSCENYVEEIRTALNKAGFKAPYVLMPHSVSSVFSEYYAEKYPSEIDGIISLDGTSSAIEGEMPAIVKYVLPIAKFQQAIGLTSLLGPLATNRKSLVSFGYTEKEINDMLAFSGFSMNDNVLDQMLNSTEFIKQAKEFPFPESIPYFKIISKQTYEVSNSELKKLGITPQEYQEKHLERIGKQTKLEILDGTHFIYLNNADRIAEIADAFLLK
ncbi:MAG: alpha/beta hydrolase [Firmicutes bacterium HGW-Firmicutes-16]|nr:MAG: alpha/beta hydrolase [Firmicutes bacterium HGW-Firmicutes-16]